MPLQQILPSAYEYQVDNYNELEPKVTSENVIIGQIVVDLLVNINTKEDTLKWVNEFQEKSKTTMRLTRTYPVKGSKGKLHLSASNCEELVRLLADRSKNLDKGFVKYLYNKFHVMHLGELYYFNASAAFDWLNISIALLYTNCVAEALLLGIFLTSDESEVTNKNALNLLKEILPDNSFYGCESQLGSAVIITDNSYAKHNALLLCWPSSIRLLCIFHVLQLICQWLYDSKYKILKDDCALIM
ncbi:21072_t:CDS:2 [Gigaspora margarita]|uniref:21072_t:CDS:1 n=1 Tax=Gigaspora margarita TaxID=4874 RepID=A0ABN7VAK2_GIGMA|nr:21072_t:CDS:2 [Gigaspora margarita]